MGVGRESIESHSISIQTMPIERFWFLVTRSQWSNVENFASQFKAKKSPSDIYQLAYAD